ncbi:MAG: helix-turn-helix domain-containing protein [bacterium]|nr:helix-turn-helix domain-containing protein [bacterium]
MRSKYTQEIKLEVLEKVKSGKSVQAVAEEYGIKAKAIYDIKRRNSECKEATELELNKVKKERDILYEIIGKLVYEGHKGKKS